MRILYVTPAIPWPLSNGGAIRNWNFLQGLLHTADVDVLAFRREGQAVDAGAFAGCGRVIEALHVTMTSRERRLYESTLGRGWLTLETRWPYEYLAARRTDLRPVLEPQVDARTYDLVWFRDPFHAMQMTWLEGPPKILDGDDFDYVREWLMLRSSAWYGAKTWNYLNVGKLWMFERSLHRRFAYVVRCSELDVRRHPAPNVVAIPNGTFVPAHPEREPEPRLMFVGELAYEPNRQGVEWFLSFVWPAIRRAIPNASVDIVGKRASAVIEQMHGKDGVVVHGFVADLAPMFRAASASIVPLQAGGGTRLKILESLAYGVPVVSTHIGAFGIDADADRGVERADSVEAFAEHCVRHLRAPADGSARASRGREFIAAHYDWRVIQNQVSALALKAARPRLGTTAPAVSPGVSTPA